MQDVSIRSKSLSSHNELSPKSVSKSESEEGQLREED